MFKLEFDTDNAAFSESGDEGAEIVRILRETADRIERRGMRTIPIRCGT